MGKRLSFLCVLALVLIGPPLQSREFTFAGSQAYQALLRATYSRLGRFAGIFVPSKIPLLADGGGGGDGGGGSGDGGGAGAGGAGDGTGGTGDGTGGTGDGTGGNGDGTGDSSSAADAAAATSDAAATAATSDDAASTAAAATSDDAAAAAAAAAATTDAATVAAVAAATTTTTANNAPDAPANTDPSAVAPSNTDPSAPTAPPTDPTNNANAIDNDPTAPPTTVTIGLTPELAAIVSIPTTDPRGGEGVVPTVNNGAPIGAAPALGGPVAAPVDVAINAVIVSAAQSPWDAIRRAPGVRNVIITGGIIALGKTPIPGEMPGGGPQPAWLRLIPDLRLLNGSAIPPVVPNVIDIRIMNCPIAIDQINNPP
ncbi:MAG: hypothetical protein JO077_06250 [Verrucomicrobia bacterium]|nr:hypothetical protein [Verrucomicrobiota bacterium]